VFVLRSTITAALAMRYPHRTYVLDDGRRAEVRALCKDLGAEYLTRPDNRGAKAGNINAALPVTQGEFVAVFDADHAPFVTFLTELLGYFEDPSVALVQAPQAYYNLDSFQHYGRRRDRSGAAPWHEQSVFFDRIMPGKDRHNAAFWCGSTAILRRSALEAIGGVDTHTIIEDMHTTIALHARGWRSVYHDRELAVGIAPDDSSAFLVQRSRWARGAIQFLHQDNPLFHRGLSLQQRVSYFASVAYVFEYLPKAIYLLTPVVALFFGALPMHGMGWALLTHFLPFWVAGLVTTRLLSGGTTPYFESERFYLLKLGVMLQAAATYIVPGHAIFKVTPKSGDGGDHRLAELRNIRAQLGFGVASLAAAAWAAVAVVADAPWQLQGLDLFMTAGWALMNSFLVASLVRTLLQRHHRRRVYRFPVDLRARVSAEGVTAPARLTDLSGLGAGFECPGHFPVGSTVTLSFETQPGRPIGATIQLSMVRDLGDGRAQYGGAFTELRDADRRQLVLFLYQLHAPSLFRQAEELPLAQQAGTAPAPALAA